MENVIGIDLGGTKITGAVVSSDGDTRHRVTVPTEAARGRADVVTRVIALIEDLSSRSPISAIGLGTPGCVDVNQGKVLFVSDNMPGWSGTDLRQELQRVFDGPVVIENDANCAAVGEAWLGAGRGYDSFLMVTLGTGVGGAIYHRETGVWHGRHWRGGEIGHAIIYPGGIPCNCGQVGCADQYLSGTALRHAYERQVGTAIDTKEIFTKAGLGDAICQTIVEQFASDLAVFLTTLKNTLDPQAFIMGGGLIYAREAWWDKALAYYIANCVNADETSILPAQFENEAGYLGAAKLALEAALR